MFARQRRCSRITSKCRTLLRLDALEDRWVPASPVVTNTNDAGLGSLRAAVVAINNNGNPDPSNTITFQLTGGSTWDIYLQSELVLNANVSITGPDIAGLPSLTIHGWKAGEGFVLVGSRVFTVGEGRSVNLHTLRLVDGAAPFTDPNGGLIKVLNAGRLIVRNSTLQGGSARNDGGGIWGGTDSRVTVTDSEIRNNKAGVNGGGIAFSGDQLTIQTTGGSILHSLSLYPTKFLYNEAGNDGGGIWVSGTGNATSARVSISKVSVNGNVAGESGGGLYLSWNALGTGVPVELTDVCVRGNDAIRNFAGGIFVSARTRMTRGAVVQNTARQPEAAIYDPGRRLIPEGVIEVTGNIQVIPEVPQGPTDPIPPTALYIGSGAEVWLIEATIDASGDGATYFWNEGQLEISDSEDPRGISSSEFIGNYTQTATGIFVVDLNNTISDQFQVSGAGYQITLAGTLSTLALWSTPPAVGTVYTIIRNDTGIAVEGTFYERPNGKVFAVNDVWVRITYHRSRPGEDPDDVLLTVVGDSPGSGGYIGGSTWNDLDGDGVWDSGEGVVGGVQVYLLDENGTTVRTAVTAFDGTYNFGWGLGDGTYQVVFVPPSGTVTNYPTGTGLFQIVAHQVLQIDGGVGGLGSGGSGS